MMPLFRPRWTYATVLSFGKTLGTGGSSSGISKDDRGSSKFDLTALGFFFFFFASISWAAVNKKA